MIQGPGYISRAKVVALQCKADILNVYWAFYPSSRYYVGKSLNPHIDGVFRVSDAAGTVAKTPLALLFFIQFPP